MKKSFNYGVTVASNVFNDNTAATPEFWAMEALLQLFENTVMLPLVHKDFKDEVAKAGDMVHASRPGKFRSKRKVDGDAVLNQDASLTEVQVPLDQHHHISFIVYDVEDSTAIKSLIDTHITPAAKGIAQAIDQIILAQKWQFTANQIGKIGTDLTKTTLVDLNTKMNNLLVPKDGQRYFVMSANQEGDLLDAALFTDASQAGDAGAAQREATLGKKFGTWGLMSQNVPTVTESLIDVAHTGAINLVAGYAAGTSTFVVDGITGLVAVGSWVKIAGNAQIQRVTAQTDTTGNTTGITVTPALETAVVDDAVITVYGAGAINLVAGYAANYTKTLVVDGFTNAPQNGQLVSFTDASGAIYGLWESLDAAGVNTPSLTGIDLDRATEAAYANDAVIFLGPGGDFGFAFHHDSIAFVSRPLKLPTEVGNVNSQVFMDETNGLAIRVTLAYDQTYQGIRVTIDILCGVKTLDSRLGVIVNR